MFIIEVLLNFFIRNKIIFYFILSIPLSISSQTNHYLYGTNDKSFNIFGETGIVVLPNAETRKAGSLNFSYSDNQMFKYGALVVSPFDWLEASYFYHRPKDIWWSGPGTNDLDKGFNIKFSQVINARLKIALGLADFAGTGYFSREYIVGSFKADSFRITSGLGFGNFVNQDGFSNPIGALIPAFKERPDELSNNKLGGSPTVGRWFRGNAKVIFGSEFFLTKKLKGTTIKIEYDPFDYNGYFSTRNRQGANFNNRKKDSNINIGIDRSIGENASLGIFFIKGNTLNINLSFGANFSKPFFKKKLPYSSVGDSQKGITVKESFYEDLIYNINRKNIFLQSSELKDGELKVAVASSKYRNPIHVHALLGETVAEVQKMNSVPIDTLTTIGVNVGHELQRISSPLEAFLDRENAVLELVAKESTLAAGEGNAYRSYEFRPTIKYPASFTGIVPALVNHIGDPAKFYYGGIILRLDNEIQFSSRLQLNTEIHQNITNNFDEKRNFPDSLLPRVRTDIVSYLQESDTYISSMQLDYFFNPYKEVFGKFSAGILENMYAGAGVEFLYKPFEQNFSIGLEAYRAKKRAFDRKFELLDYEINTGHINFNYHLPKWGILGTLSYGKYLAGDEGYTFDISRRLASGFRTGVFFTRTNVSAELFGEGSFDKGFYFQIPIDLFLNDYRGGYINFKLRPLTRDGGQKLEAGNDLIGLMHTTSRAEIERDWGSFND